MFSPTLDAHFKGIQQAEKAGFRWEGEKGKRDKRRNSALEQLRGSSNVSIFSACNKELWRLEHVVGTGSNTCIRCESAVGAGFLTSMLSTSENLPPYFGAKLGNELFKKSGLEA